jgi:hypothetical protein
VRERDSLSDSKKIHGDKNEKKPPSPPKEEEKKNFLSLSYYFFNEKHTDDSVFRERLKPRYQAAGSRDSCGLFSLGRGWQELCGRPCAGISRGEEDWWSSHSSREEKRKTRKSYFFSPKASKKKARERC